MPSSYAPIPLPNRGTNASHRATAEPAFAAPVRWTLVVLSWLAFGIASYLAYASVTGASIAGCGPASANGCDVVLSSSWSKLLGVPVAVLGLACYATLATLSVLLGWRDANVNRSITTAFVALAIVAAVASLWFIGVQVFAIGDYCKYCLVTDACGILIGIFAVAAAAQSVLSHRAAPQARTLQPGLVSRRAATAPAAGRTSSAAAPVALPPSLVVALSGAVPLVLVLVGGQLLFRGKTHHEEQVVLKTPIKMDDTAGGNSSDSTGGTEHTTLRVPDPLEGNEPPKNDADVSNNGNNDSNSSEAVPSQGQNDATTSASPDATAKKNDEPKIDAPPAEPHRERIIKLLGGKLTLNTYQHPIIGSPEAPHIVVEMVSYDCKHCRKLNPFIHKALERYGDQVAVLVMPVPLEKSCNPKWPGESHVGACGTARRACGIAQLNSAAFAKFHDFLMSGGDKPPTTEKVVPKANGLVNRDQLREKIGSPEVNKQIDSYINLLYELQAKSSSPKTFGLPVQIVGDQVMNGSVEKVDDVYKAWEKHLGVQPK